MSSLIDIVLGEMPNLVSKHGFTVHAIGADEVLMIKGCCLLLIFMDREGVSVSVVSLGAKGMCEYSMGHYLVTKRNATYAVASDIGNIADDRRDGVVGELRWYDRALSKCAGDVLAGSADWITEYPGKPIPLAEPTVAKIREVLRYLERPQ